ncbi:MAG TPA: PadR family transcriptional regulator [Solirubrobacteraceae bacterium]|jgi:DNA-binding PadR family transcriptional regulator|nr:PadR family transcriptional regulator [Solirubrobacteraceae bacterium]
MPARAAGKEQLTGSPLQGVLLALLLGEREQQLHGYMLTTLVERRLGPAWGVTRQSVYGALNRLEEEGLVTSSWKTAALDRGGHRQRVYAASDRAEGALSEWIRSPASKEPVRVELQAKIAMSRARDAPELLKALDAYERECFEMLRQTNEAEVPMGSWAGLAINLTRMAVDESIQAELRWVTMARHWIDDFLAERATDQTR